VLSLLLLLSARMAPLLFTAAFKTPSPALSALSSRRR